jgi:Tfp pilus assembly protein FimV
MLVNAVALGEIDVRSRVGQPLEARIPLTLASGEVVDETCFSVVSTGRGESLIRQARLALRSDAGRTYLIVRTVQPILEPIAQIDLRAGCPASGANLMRSYQVLLDGPLAREQAPAAAPAPTVVPPAPAAGPAAPVAQAAAPTPAAPIPAAPSSAAAASVVPPPGDVLVSKKGDSLGSIARAKHPKDVKAQTAYIKALRANNPALKRYSTATKLPVGTELNVPAPVSSSKEGSVPPKRAEPAAKTRTASQPVRTPARSSDSRPSEVPAAAAPRLPTPLASKPSPARPGAFALRLSGGSVDLSRSQGLSEQQRATLRDKQLLLESDDQVATILQLKNSVKQLEDRLAAMQLKLGQVPAASVSSASGVPPAKGDAALPKPTAAPVAGPPSKPAESKAAPVVAAPSPTAPVPAKPEVQRGPDAKGEPSPAPPSSPPDSAKPEPVKVDVAKTEPAKVEPGKPEPLQPEPAKPDPPQASSPTLPDAAKPEAPKTEPIKAEAVKPVRPPPVKAAPPPAPPPQQGFDWLLLLWLLPVAGVVAIYMLWQRSRRQVQEAAEWEQEIANTLSRASAAGAESVTVRPASTAPTEEPEREANRAVVSGSKAPVSTPDAPVAPAAAPAPPVAEPVRSQLQGLLVDPEIAQLTKALGRGTDDDLSLTRKLEVIQAEAEEAARIKSSREAGKGKFTDPELEARLNVLQKTGRTTTLGDIDPAQVKNYRLRYMEERFPETSNGTINLADSDSIIKGARLFFEDGATARAEELLLFSIEESPEDERVWLALFEIYRLEHNVADFEHLAKRYRDQHGGTSSNWPKVLAIGAELDNANPLYHEKIQGFSSDATVAYDPLQENWLNAPMDYTPDVLALELRHGLLRANGLTDADLVPDPLPVVKELVQLPAIE